MKPSFRSVLLSVICGAFLTAALPSQVIDHYLVAKIQNHYQTSDSAAEAGSWMIDAAIEAEAGAFSEVTLSSGSTTLPMIQDTGSGDAVFDLRATYADKASFDAVWPSDLTYTFNYSGGTFGSGFVTIDLTADAYPDFGVGVLPGLTGTSWSDAQWYDPSQSLSLTWNGATYANASNALIQLRITDGVHADFEWMLAPDATGFELPADTLLLGTQYEASILFAEIVDGSLNDDFIGAFGVEVHFNLTTVPEPSTYAAILGALALAGMVLRRRLQTRARNNPA